MSSGKTQSGRGDRLKHLETCPLPNKLAPLRHSICQATKRREYEYGEKWRADIGGRETHYSLIFSFDLLLKKVPQFQRQSDILRSLLCLSFPCPRYKISAIVLLLQFRACSSV